MGVSKILIDEEGYRPNVGIVVANRRGQVLWAKRVGKQDAWQFPQGGIDDGETPEKALYRELEEEVGCIADSMEHLITLATAVGFADESISVYLARGLSWTQRKADGVEEKAMTVEHVALVDVPSMIADGTIVDAKTVAGLLIAHQRMAN